MIPLTVAQFHALRTWFLPDRPGPLVGLHLLQTGIGNCHVDRWPAPRAMLVETAGNYALIGDPATIEAADLRARVSGFVDAPEAFVALLQSAFPDLVVWPRLIATQNRYPSVTDPAGYLIRRLRRDDAGQVRDLSSEVRWIANTWGGSEGLAASDFARGAFRNDRLVAVTCSFFVGENFEDIGVVTEKDHRGKGLSTACAAALVRDILARGRKPSWSTSPDNAASLRVAQKLGFTAWRTDRLFVVGQP